MSILADIEIKELCTKPPTWGDDTNMIIPFVDQQINAEEFKHFSDGDGERSIRKILSYGLSSYGYDIRLNNKELKVFTNDSGLIVDPRKIDAKIYKTPEILFDESDNAAYVILPPNTGLLGHSVEYFRIPKDVVGTALGKSTYARCFISVIVTPLEPGWEGQLVIEVVNHSPLPTRVYLNQGICQIMFHKGNPCEVNYGDRRGKYMRQLGTIDAIV